MSDDILKIGEFEFRSRLFTGTGKYPDLDTARGALEASGCEVVTVAVRRVDLAAHTVHRHDHERPSGRELHDPPEHGGLLHSRRRRAHFPTRTRASGHAADQARSHRRREGRCSQMYPQRSKPRRYPRRRWIHRLAVFQRRPGCGPSARGHRVRGRDAARRTDRKRPRRPQPVQHRNHREARRTCR